MSTAAATAVRSTGWAGLCLGAALVGALAVAQPVLAVAVVALAALGLLLTAPTAAAVLAVALMPFGADLVPGAALQLGAPDLLLVTALAGWAVQAMLAPGRQSHARRGETAPSVVRATGLGLALYAATLLVSFVAHPSVGGVIAVVQRTELVVGGLLLGAGLVRHGRLHTALDGYLLGCVALALSATATFSAGGMETFLGVQKNPAGGFLATALILALVLRPGRRWMLYAPVLAAGLVGTQSRGALIGLAVGGAATVLVVRYGERVKVLALAVVTAGVGYVGFLNLPASARDRLTNVSGIGDFAIRYREEYQADASEAFQSSPWWGTGVGSYAGGPRQPDVTDPHQVLYFQLAEGGVILLVGFLALCLVSLWVAFRALRHTRLAVAALAVQLSTLTHALGDVYWVRGTPVPAYLLLGATVAVVFYARAGDPRAARWSRPKHAAARRSDAQPARVLVRSGA